MSSIISGGHSAYQDTFVSEFHKFTLLLYHACLSVAVPFGKTPVRSHPNKTGRDDTRIHRVIYTGYEHQQETEDVFGPIFYFDIFKVQNPKTIPDKKC